MPKKEKKAPIAPNDITRPDYSILGSLLDREIQVPEDHDEACKVLKSALEEAYNKKPNKLIITCSTNRRSNAKKALAQFMDGSGKGLNEEVLGFVASRLWNRNPSGRESVHRDVDKKNPSSNAIRYWDPDKCGVVPYMNARIGLVMKDYWKEKALETADVSLDGLAEKGLELSSNMIFVKQQRSSDHEIDLDRSEGDEPSEMNLKGGARQFVGDSSDVGDDDGYAQEYVPDERVIGEFVHKDAEIDDAEAQRKGRKNLACQSTSSPNRSDLTKLLKLPIFAEKKDLKISEKPEIRNVQIKGMALRALQEYAGDHEEYEEVYSIVDEEWNPDEVVLEGFAPDALDLISEGLEKSLEQPVVAPENGDDQLEMFGATEVSNDSDFVQDPRYSYMTEDEILRDDEMQANLWRSSGAEEDLTSPTRSDYQYLCYRFKRKPQPNLNKVELYEQLSEMGVAYVTNTLPVEMLHLKPAQKQLIEDMENWNPSVKTFQGCIQESILNMMDQGSIEQLEEVRLAEEERIAVACIVEAQQFDEANAKNNLFDEVDLAPEPKAEKLCSIQL